ncbi:MAG: hypothetical protein ACPL0B_02900, partial [Anaerolineales bacterium]
MDFPLARYLPPYYPNSVVHFLQRNTNIESLSQGQIILDPFGSSPLACVELAQHGFSILTCSNNPINRLLIEILAQPPSREELLALIAEIASLKKGNIRLESFIRSFYQSTCNNCGSDVEVEAYIWEKTPEETSHHLSQKKFHCNVCGEMGEFPIDDSDIENLKKIPPFDLFAYDAANKVLAHTEEDWQTVFETIQL